MTNQTNNSFKASFKGEWVKLYQSRVFKVLMIILIISILFSGLILSNTVETTSTSFFYKINAINIIPCTIFFILIGCTNSTNEYHFNTIYITLLSVNSRKNVILAKALLLTLISLIATLITLVCTTLLAILANTLRHNSHPILIFNSAAIHECIFFPLFIAMFTILSFSVGIIIRNKTTTISFLFIWWLILENSLLFIPKIGDKLYALSPIANGMRSYGINTSQDDSLWFWNPSISSIYFLIWTIALLFVAERLFAKRNV